MILQSIRRYGVGFVVFGVILLFARPSLASGSHQPIAWGFLILGLLGGLALFLYGMEMMSEGMKKTAGNRMRAILSTLTRNRVIALFCGAFVTMVIQSSSATTVMLVSFVQAGLMSFAQSLGVILGADIGTTVTAQMIAFKLTDYTMLMVATGFGVRMFGKSATMKHVGETILGFGLLFFGMKLMSDAMAPLRTYGEFIEILKGLENPLLGLLVGAVFTALIQSSSAFTGLLIVLAQQQLITLEAGIPMVFGANIGTCVTAGLASIGASREAKRVAIAHVLFKVAGVLLFIFWIPTLAGLIRVLAVQFDSDAARQIANAHTIFNVSLALLFLPFTQAFAWLILRILPEKPVSRDLQPVTWYLDESQISSPVLAIELARTEIARMAKLLWRMLEAVIRPFMDDKPHRDRFFPQLSLKAGIDMREEKLDFLEEKIREYLLQIGQGALSAQQVNEIYAMLTIVSNLEAIGDLVHRNLVPLIDKKRAISTDFSLEGKQELVIYHTKVCNQIKLLEGALIELDLAKAHTIMERERAYLDMDLQYEARHLERVFSHQAEAKATHEIHMELMDIFKQIIVFSSEIARTFARIER
jgi:phosphate:Na+ symporter